MYSLFISQYTARTGFSPSFRLSYPAQSRGWARRCPLFGDGQLGCPRLVKCLLQFSDFDDPSQDGHAAIEFCDMAVMDAKQPQPGAPAQFVFDPVAFRLP